MAWSRCKQRWLRVHDLDLFLSGSLIMEPVDLYLNSAHKLLNKLRRHQALPETIENHPFEVATADALAVFDLGREGTPGVRWLA
jgi:hypothetical protein